MRRKYSVASKFRKPLSLDGLYYSHGLMCASYPRTVIALVGFVVIVCSLPFFVTPSGDLNKPKYWRSPWLNYRIQATPQMIRRGEEPEWIINKPSQSSGRTPSWFVGMPVAVVQQLYVNLEINCQQVDQLCDKSYYSTSKLISAQLLSRMEQAVSACQPVIHPAAANLTRTLSLHDPSPPLPLSRPPSGVLSPVLDSFRIKWEDMPLGYHSIKELIYGGFWEHEHRSAGPGDTTPSHVPSPEAHKQHTLALTLLLQSRGREDFKALVQCVEGIKGLWPDQEEKAGSLRFMKHFYYEPEWSLLDFAPLMSVYSIVFLYMSFSVGKIDLVKSKIGLGFTAFVTVVAGLTMSLGICTFFGLSISLSGSEIYPYVVIVIGVENILIIVKAVMSTPEELEVKYRIAVGLSKEGWAITRNLITLAFMTSMGIVFFNYVLKEFCIIALVGLLSDAFLQLVFFPTVLSIDLRRLELTDISTTSVPVPENGEKPGQCRPRCPSSLRGTTPMRWRSKRIKFIYFLAQTRLVSRILMFSFFVLLCALFVTTHTFHNLVGYLHSGPDATPSPLQNAPGTIGPTAIPDTDAPGFTFSTDLPTVPSSRQEGYKGQETGEGVGNADLMSALNQSSVSISRRRENGFRVQCEDGEVCWRPMVTTHWPRLLSHAGVNMDGRFLTLLPPIYLDFFLGYTPTTLPPSPIPSLLMRIVYHPLIIRISSILGGVFLISCYLCGLIKSSRFRHERYMRSVRVRGYNRMVCLKGHSQDVDYLCVDSGLVVTTSLDGDIRVWDANPMKRRCFRVIARSELCREPPAEVSSTSHRPAAEGCEAADALTSMKPSIFSRRESTASYLSKSSSVSDYGDHHGNRVGPRSTSRLSSVSDISSWDHLETSGSAPLGAEYPQAMAPVHRHFPTDHDMPTPPSPPAIPVRRIPSQTSDVGGVYTSPGSPIHRTNSHPSNLHALPPVCPAGNDPSTGTAPFPHSYATSNLPTSPARGQGTTPATLEASTHTSANGRTTVTRPSAPLSNLQSLQSKPHPSATHAQQHTWQHSPVLARSHPNHHTSHQERKPPLPPTSHEFPPPQPHPHETVVSAIPGMSGSHVSPRPQQPSCVHVQLELEMAGHAYSVAGHTHSSVGMGHSGAGYPTTGGGGAGPVAMATGDPKPMLQQSRSYPNLPMQAANTPILPSNLHVSLSRKMSAAAGGTGGVVPDIKVDIPADTISQMRRLGHSRHLSLGRTPPRQRPLHAHARNRSLGSITPSQVMPLSTINSTHGSCSNLSVMSNAGSDISAASSFLTASQLTRLPDADKGYDFAKHFNVFSQYTSNMALEYCVGDQGSKEHGPIVPPVWCMAFWNRVVAVGCGNGQLEAWNVTTGSLIFNLNIGSTGISSITMSSSGIITGQMDGTLSLSSYNGLLHHCVPAHDKAISVLRWYRNKIISGGYDNAVKVHCMSASGHSLVCVNSVHVHEGNITAVTVVESELKLGCVSGCSKGLVIHWDINSGSCICEFGLYKSPVLQLEPTISTVVGLFGEGCVRVWDVVTGYLLHTIALDGVCHHLTVLSSLHIALCLESSVEVYDLESGKPHSEKQLETERGSMTLVRHIQALDGASVVCSSGKDLYIVPCDLKLKND